MFKCGPTEDGETTSYGYDAASQLTSEIRPGYNAGYTFDGNGNRLSKTVNGNTEFYSYDNGDKLLSAGIKTYTYDQAGRTTSVKVGMGAPLVLTYDDEDRLKTFMGQTYTYNGFDTRVGKTVGGSTTSYHRDGSGVTAPLISDSGATYTPGVSERRNGVSTFLNSGLKDVAKQTDAAGVVTATRKYDAYGMVIGSTGTWKGPFGYSGSAGYQEDETGLQLLGHRYYDSSTGRFITRDPIKDGRNWYGYCDNNPVSFVDPTGLFVTSLDKPGSATTVAELIEEGHLVAVAPKPAPTPPGCLGALMRNAKAWLLGLLLGGATRAGCGNRKPKNPDKPYPPNNGAKPGTERPVELQPGQQVERRGGPNGVYVSPPGQAPGSLSLPPSKQGVTADVYVIQAPIIVIESEVLPWYDQPGGGKQWELPKPISDLPMERKGAHRVRF